MHDLNLFHLAFELRIVPGTCAAEIGKVDSEVFQAMGLKLLTNPEIQKLSSTTNTTAVFSWQALRLSGATFRESMELTWD